MKITSNKWDNAGEIVLSVFLLFFKLGLSQQCLQKCVIHPENMLLCMWLHFRRAYETYGSESRSIERNNTTPTPTPITPQ